MGRPEWIVVAVVLSVGLIGAVATTVADAWSTVSDDSPAGSFAQHRLASGDGSTGTAGRTRTVAGVVHAPVSIVAAGGVGANGNVVWLLGGGAIGLLLVAVLAVVRYGGFPADAGDDRTDTTSAHRAASDDAEAVLREQPSPESVGVDDAAIADDRRVLDLLEDGGGRMKQTAIVEETEWSKSKVSMLLSEMEDEGEIRKIQVGRENIIALEGHEPEAASSPFDDAE